MSDALPRARAVAATRDQKREADDPDPESVCSSSDYGDDDNVSRSKRSPRSISGAPLMYVMLGSAVVLLLFFLVNPGLRPRLAAAWRGDHSSDKLVARDGWVFLELGKSRNPISLDPDSQQLPVPDHQAHTRAAVSESADPGRPSPKSRRSLRVLHR